LTLNVTSQNRPSGNSERERTAGGDTAGAGKVELAFEDNRLAGVAFGEHDRNLALIESRLGVDIIARGNRLTVSGSEAARQAAVRVLEELYQRAAAGLEITSGDVDGAIRMATALPAPAGGVVEIRTRRRVVRPRSPGQRAYLEALQDNELVFGIGPAGTGKTYLAVAHAVQELLAGRVDRIILSRPAVEAGEQLGFLPGDMKEKVDPYLRPLYDALDDLVGREKASRMMADGTIEIAPLAFMRGRTLSNAAVILDEAQNTTSQQMKMFLTRLGEGARMVINGDLSQIDLPPGVASGLAEAVDILKGVKGVAVVRFGDADIVRHPLVARIVAAYEAAARRPEEKGAGRCEPAGEDG
jgi:phosphate starvation-inducible PhoH-like protein